MNQVVCDLGRVVGRSPTGRGPLGAYTGCHRPRLVNVLDMMQARMPDEPALASLHLPKMYFRCIYASGSAKDPG